MNGSSVTIVSTGENARDLAQDDAEDEKLMAERQNEIEKLFGRFINIAMNSTTEFARPHPEMSMNIPSE